MITANGAAALETLAYEAEGLRAVFAFDAERGLSYGERSASATETALTGLRFRNCSLSSLFAAEGILKYTFVFSESAFARAFQARALMRLGQAGLTVQISKPDYVEITDAHANKGTGAQIIANHLQLSPLISVGDGENDIPLFRVSDQSYAMPHAPPEVRASATTVLRHPGAYSLVALVARIACQT
jgi:hydroxymethylpyrimidine pyrophosphatase-like HAD family hydrolase